MKGFKFPLVVFLLFCTTRLAAQQWSLHLNGNEYYPLGADGKGYYPILWYSSDAGRGVLLGGFGAGVSWSKDLKEKWSLKAQLNVSRSRYYDAPVYFSDENGNALGASTGITTNLNLALLAVPRYRLTNWLQVGAGLGAHVTPLAKSDYGSVIFFGKKESLRFDNKSMRPLVLVLPVEIGFSPSAKRLSLCYRLETALTGASRLPFAAGERFLLSVVELGWRL